MLSDVEKISLRLNLPPQLLFSARVGRDRVSGLGTAQFNLGCSGYSEATFGTSCIVTRDYRLKTLHIIVTLLMPAAFA